MNISKMPNESWFQKLLDAIFGSSKDAEVELEKRAKAHPELHWKTSIVDLMKLVGEDSSLKARIRLAKELHWHGEFDGSDGMNEFLHAKVLERLGIKNK